MDKKDKTWALVLIGVIVLLIGLLVYRLGLSQNLFPMETPIPTPTSETVPEISLPPMSTVTSTPSSTVATPTPIGNIIPAPNTF